MRLVREECVTPAQSPGADVARRFPKQFGAIAMKWLERRVCSRLPPVSILDDSSGRVNTGHEDQFSKPEHLSHRKNQIRILCIGKIFSLQTYFEFKKKTLTEAETLYDRTRQDTPLVLAVVRVAWLTCSTCCCRERRPLQA